MKRLVFILVMLAACYFVQAQLESNPYFPMLQNGKVWATEHIKSNNIAEISEHRIDGDTIINGEVWKKVYTNYYRNGTFYYVGAIREENKKVYVILTGSETKWLLYNFNLEVGDIIYCDFNSDNNIYYLHEPEEGITRYQMSLHEIDTIFINGNKLRRFFFESRFREKAPASDKKARSFTYPTLVWVEGIGSEGGLFQSWYTVNDKITVSLNGEVVFDNSDFHITYDDPQKYLLQPFQWKFNEYSCNTDETYLWSYLFANYGSWINNIEYKMLYAVESRVNNGEENMILYEELPIRESNGKIYCLVKNSKNEYNYTKEIVLYDFTVSVGDTVMQRYYEPDKDNYAVVTSIEEITLKDGRTAKKINYDKRPSDIEYVGNTEGFLYPLYGSHVAGGYAKTFLCCTNGEKLLYESHAGDCESYINPEKPSLPIPDHWLVLHKYNVPGFGKSDYFMTDSIINDTLYSFIDKQTGFIRYSDDYQKMYYRGSPSSPDYLLCDFSAEVGDTCFLYTATNLDLSHPQGNVTEEDNLKMLGMGILSPWVVKDKSTIDGRIHIVVELTCKEEDFVYQVECVQGIGTPHFPFLLSGSIGCIGCDSRYSMCALKGDEVLYSYDLSEFGITDGCSDFEIVNNPVEYFPQSTTWKYKEYSYYTDKTYYYQSYIDGDTIIDGVSYKILNSGALCYDNGKEFVCDSRIPIRESQGKVYCRVENREGTGFVEVLLYDFNVSVGDKVMRSYYEPDEDNDAVVTSIEEITLSDGRTAKKINYDKRPSDIEYVGSTEGFLHALWDGLTLGGFFPSFLCCTNGEELLYESHEGDCESYNKTEKEHHTFPDTWYCINEQRSWGANPNGPDDVSLNMAKYYLDGDTVINDTIYNKLYYNSYYIDSDNKNLHLIGGIRYNSDTSKIFIRPIIEGKSVEYLLYDYNLQIGDTCYAFCRGVDDWFISGNERIGAFAHMMICKDITIVGNQRRFTMQNKSLEHEPLLVWIENIGTLYGLFGRAHTFDISDEQYSDHPLLCALKGDEVLYSRPDSELTHIGHYGIINNCSSFEEIKTDVENITVDLDPDSPMFNVLGLPVGKDYRGIVIQNGRKYVVL